MRHVTLLPVVLLAACSTAATDLAYTSSTPPIMQGVPNIAAVTVADAREEKDPTYVGAIRGGFGNPLKTVTTKRPIADEVRSAFEAALAARHMLGGQGGDTLAVQVTKLSANQLVRRDASAAFYVELRDRSGRSIYSDAVDVNRVNGGVVTFDAGILASTADLHAIMEQTMTEAIDRALDKPAFAAALHPGS